MVKTMSLTRKEYSKAYALLRYCHGHNDFPALDRMNENTVICAIVSYDYHDSHFAGWINRQRMSKFHEIKRYYTMRDFGLLS
jgi:hypothetical protein